MTFIDRAYYVGYIDDITILIDRPKRGTYKPNCADIDKENDDPLC